MRLATMLALAMAVGCSKSEAKVEPASSASAPRKHEDRHDPAEPGPPLSLQVTIAGTTKTWDKGSFDRVPKMTKGSVGNDGEDRDTWSLRELAHVLVGPQARVVSVAGPERTRTIDVAAWNDASRTPILHTTRRGTLKFRWADKDGKWSETEVKDVGRVEIQP